MANFFSKNLVQMATRWKSSGAGTDADPFVPQHRFTAQAMAAADITSATAVNSAVTLSYAASAGYSHVISGIVVSYSGTPTAGNVQILDGTATAFNASIRSAGEHVFMFPYPKKGTAGNKLDVVLAAGATDATGYISVINHWTE